jgi:hypothetical protein
VADDVPASTALAFVTKVTNIILHHLVQYKWQISGRQSVLKTDVINQPEKGEWIDICHNFMLLTPCMFLWPAYFPTYARNYTIYIQYIQTPTCFSTQVPSSGSYHNKAVQASLLIYVLVTGARLIKTLVAKIHKMYTIYKIDIVNSLDNSFDNSLIISCLSIRQLLVSAFWCSTLTSSHFVCCFGVADMSSVYKHQNDHVK